LDGHALSRDVAVLRSPQIGSAKKLASAHAVEAKRCRRVIPAMAKRRLMRGPVPIIVHGPSLCRAESNRHPIAAMMIVNLHSQLGAPSMNEWNFTA